MQNPAAKLFVDTVAAKQAIINARESGAISDDFYKLFSEFLHDISFTGPVGRKQCVFEDFWLDLSNICQNLDYVGWIKFLPHFCHWLQEALGVANNFSDPSFVVPSVEKKQIVARQDHRHHVDTAAVLQGIIDACNEKKISEEFYQLLVQEIILLSIPGPSGRKACTLPDFFKAFSKLADAKWTQWCELLPFVQKSLSSGLTVARESFSRAQKSIS